MRKKIICLIFAAFLLGVADYACGHARWRNNLGDQDFSNPANWADQPGLLTGRMIIDWSPTAPGDGTDPPIMSYTPDPCYSPISLYTGDDADEYGLVEWYITGGSLWVNGWWDMCRIANTGSYTLMTGGYLHIREHIACPVVSGESAILLIHGGMVRAAEIRFQSGGLIDIAGSGKLVIDGNNVSAAAGWVTSGYLTADGGLGEITISYTSDPNETTIMGSSIRAWEPQPENNQENLCPGIALSWNPGASAAETQGHDVYFGTDFNDVNDSTTSTGGSYIGRQDGNSYTPTLTMDKTTYYWRVDETDGIDIWKGSVWEFTTNDGTAFDPNAPDASSGFPIDGVLSWSPGCLADTHDVYFGTDFNDVNEASTLTVGIFKANQAGTSFDPNGDLDYATDYYWRIDEVASGGSPVWRGKVWTFQSAYAIVDPNLRLWYTFDGNEEENGTWVFDSSGREFHSSDGTVDDEGRWEPNDGHFGGSLWCDEDIGLGVSPDMLKFSDGITISVWLKDAYNTGGDNVVCGAGDGDYEIRCDVVEDSSQEVMFRAGNDGNDVIRWRPNENPASLEGWHHWGFVKSEVTGELSIYYDGRLAISADTGNVTLSNLENTPFKVGSSGSSNTDLVAHIDDFRVYDYPMNFSKVAKLFRGEDAEKAWLPIPSDNSKDVPREVILEWFPGDFAVSHDVYLGTDWDDVNDATTASALIYKGRQDPCDYDPPTDLLLNTTYYWRIDEVNTVDPNLWKGEIWRFTVANFIIIDDFEAYNNDANKIFDTWEDGNVNFTGSFLDLGSAPFDPAHGGSQSMLYVYDNVIKWDWDHYWSEAKLPFDPAKDFTSDGLIKVLTLYFYGDPDNDVNDTEELYVGLTGSLAEVWYTDDAGQDMNDLKVEEWTEWNIPISDFNDPDPVDPCAVTGLLIGFGDRNNTSVVGGDGVVYFDNIRLYPPRCIPELGPALDFSGNCIVDWADVRMMVADWLVTDTVLSPITAPDPCILHYKFDETSGTTAADASGNDYTGTFFDDVDQTPVDITGRSDAGVDGNSFHFTSPEYIGVKMPTTVFTENGISQEITVAAWIKNAHPEEDPDGTAFMWEFREWDGASPDANERVLAVEVSGSGDTYTLLDRSESVSYDLDWDEHTEWQHYGFVRDANNLAIWVNGSVAAVSDSNGTAMATPGLLYAGISADRAPGNTEGMHDGFTGNMDDWKIYNYALSAAEMGYLGTGGTGYVPLLSAYDLYDGEPQGSKAVNIRDLAVVLNSWLEEKLWP